MPKSSHDIKKKIDDPRQNFTFHALKTSSVGAAVVNFFNRGLFILVSKRRPLRVVPTYIRFDQCMSICNSKSIWFTKTLKQYKIELISSRNTGDQAGNNSSRLAQPKNVELISVTGK
ncbi:hypothetical protein DASC09_034950 [Saccharomycopsis crataegensis]|uniref:Uncharacterized protein n=1 Tax=Saccharomycopsis crataegensis TaxID=43959 RepID=A0AAV5QPB8_9ASCO|nr:hypothetical protein DASC09_034950 [Saccharomycopsis crataegensis]